MYFGDVVINTDLSEDYTIVRSTNGVFGPGGWSDEKTEIKNNGVVSLARSKDLQMIPEADQVLEARVFYSSQPLYVTRDNPQDGTGTSDILVWKNVRYRILNVMDYSNRGYWKAVAARMSGV